jgi:hypothetical protein
LKIFSFSITFYIHNKIIFKLNSADVTEEIFRALAEFRPLNENSNQVARKSTTQLIINPFSQLAKKPGAQMARKSTTQLSGLMHR